VLVERSQQPFHTVLEHLLEPLWACPKDSVNGSVGFTGVEVQAREWHNLPSPIQGSVEVSPAAARGKGLRPQPAGSSSRAWHWMVSQLAGGSGFPACRIVPESFTKIPGPESEARPRMLGNGGPWRSLREGREEMVLCPLTPGSGSLSVRSATRPLGGPTFGTCEQWRWVMAGRGAANCRGSRLRAGRGRRPRVVHRRAPVLGCRIPSVTRRTAGRNSQPFHTGTSSRPPPTSSGAKPQMRLATVRAHGTRDTRHPRGGGRVCKSVQLRFWGLA
jgi:hypothetical protein